jgi:hypothetical protein
MIVDEVGFWKDCSGVWGYEADNPDTLPDCLGCGGVGYVAG